jgi:hypothetical protein
MFFNAPPEWTALSYLEGNSYRGQTFENGASMTDKPYAAGDFFFASKDSDQPKLMDVPNRSTVVVSFMDGVLENPDEITKLTGVAEGPEGHEIVKLLTMLNSSDLKQSEEQKDLNFYAKVENRLVRNVKGRVSYCLANINPSPVIVLGSTIRELRMNIVFFDGVWALVFTNDSSMVNELIRGIHYTPLKNRIFIGRNILQKKDFCVLHMIHMLSNFKHWYKTFEGRSESLLTVPSMEKYLTKRSGSL